MHNEYAFSELVTPDKHTSTGSKMYRNVCLRTDLEDVFSFSCMHIKPAATAHEHTHTHNKCADLDDYSFYFAVAMVQLKY